MQVRGLPRLTSLFDQVDGMPVGLPFLGDRRPPCSEPDAVVVFGLAGADGSEYNRDAKAICEPCPYREACAEWAISNNERWGVWGGMTRTERRRAVRRRESTRAT